jgi:hypothetical protein
MNGKRIDAIYAWVAQEPDGGEGVCSATMQYLGREMMMPLIGADIDRVKSLRQHARTARMTTGFPVRLVRFSMREDLEELPNEPGFWMNEKSGALHDAVEAYLFNAVLAPEHIAALRAYLRQWIAVDTWQGPRVAELRNMVEGLTTREAVDRWIAIAVAENMDPL